MKILLLLLVLIFVSVKADNSQKIVLKITNNTYNLDMKCNDYKNLAKGNQRLPPSMSGFFIGRLEEVIIPYQVDSGLLGIMIKKNEIESSGISKKVNCILYNDTEHNQEFNLKCPLKEQYDTIILVPSDDDTIIIKDIGLITIAKSLSNDTKSYSDNENYTSSFCYKNLFIFLFLFL